MSTNAGMPKISRPTLKVILVGNSGVGKTCLIASYFKQAFDFQTSMTVAPAYSCSDVKRKDGITVSLQIWDTAGQERYHSVSKLFFRDSDVAFICFEAGDSTSTSDIENWINQVRGEVPRCPIILVATKIDLQTKESLDQLEIDTFTHLKEQFQSDVVKTSALSKEGVYELFEKAADIYRPKVSMSNVENPKKTENKKGCC